MEKFENMQHNKIDDDELEQISGGRNIFEAFTAEFRGSDKKPNTLEMDLDEEDTIGISTLEMRANPNKKKKPGKIIRL